MIVNITLTKGEVEDVLELGKDGTFHITSIRSTNYFQSVLEYFPFPKEKP